MEFIARLCIAALFGISATTKFMNWRAMVADVAKTALPLPAFSLGAALVTEVIGTTLLVSGFFLKSISIVLILYVVGASAAVLVPQLFRQESRPTALLMISNNFAIVGGLMLLALYAG